MGSEIEKYIKNLVLEHILDGNVGNNLDKILQIYDKLQKNLDALKDKGEDIDVVGLKVFTVFTFSILKKFREGKNLKDFKEDDWTEVLDDISKFAILQDKTEYVIFVFAMYENCIRALAKVFDNISPNNQEKVNNIYSLADKIARNSDKLRAGKISEIDYIEECLWTSLEAMIKIAALHLCLNENNKYGELSYAIAVFAFEYGRFTLTKQEQELVNEYISMQQQLDEELRHKYEELMKKIEKQSKEFLGLVENAFDPDFENQFRGSAALAEKIGVPKEEVLSTIDDIDSFFN